MPPSKNISFEELSQYFHLPINQVAKELGVCATILKKTCRKNGIPRWPHRKIKSLDNRIANLQVNLEKNPQDRDEIQKEIELLRSKKQEIMKHPDILVRSASRNIEVTSTKLMASPPSASTTPSPPPSQQPQQTPVKAATSLPIRNGSDSSLGPLPNLFTNVPSSGVSPSYSMLSQYYSNSYQQPQQQPSLEDMSYLSNPMNTRMNEYLAYERFMNSGKTALVSAPSSLFNAPAPNYVAPPSSLFGDNSTTTSPFALPSQQANAPRDNTIPNPSSLFGNALPPTTNMNNTLNLQGNNWTVSIGKNYNAPAPNNYGMYSGYNGMKEMQYDMKFPYEQRNQAPVVDEKASIQRNISDYLAMARATGIVPPEFQRFPAEDIYQSQRRGFESELASIQANQSFGNYEKPNASL